MAKVITTIAPENGMDYGDISCFKTESYIGFWEDGYGKFVLMPQSSGYFDIRWIDEYPKNLAALDDAVMEEVNEHITEVFDDASYYIVLNSEVR